MAFKQSYTKPLRTESTSFAGKYSLSKVAGVNEPGKECFVIPLETNIGFTVLPCHSLKKVGNEGFKGSTFSSSKIRCKRYTDSGDLIDELPLCCQIANMERDRVPDKDDYAKKIMSFSSARYVIPVLVLFSADTELGQPSLKKLSLKRVDFSYIELAKTSYEDDIHNPAVEQLIASGTIERREDVNTEELNSLVLGLLQKSIIKISATKGKSKEFAHVKKYTIIPLTNELIAKDTGETKDINYLCRVLTGTFPAEQLDALYKSKPNIRAINNQALEYLTIFNDNVDSLVADYTDEELQEYYNKFLAKQKQINDYKDYNDVSSANAAQVEEVSFKKPVIKSSMSELNIYDMYNEDGSVAEDEFPGEPVTPKAKGATDDFDFDLDDMDKPVPKKKAEKSKFDTSDLEESSALDGLDFDEDDFAMSEDDAEDFGFEG